MTYSATRHGIWFLTLLLTSISAQNMACATETIPDNARPTVTELVSADYTNFYHSERLLRMGIVFGVAGIAANSNIDMNLRNGYQDNVRSERTNSWSSDPHKDVAFNAKFFGEGKYLVPIALLSASVNLIGQETAVGNWGANASRAYITGLPAMWFMQAATGASRPDETPEGSVWRPFNDGNGVSGHSFVGAVPFLTLARMNPDNGWVKYPAYLASAAAGWSRINDDKHFPSQVVLGWYMAWEAVDAVFDTNAGRQKGFVVRPMAGLDGFGLMASTRW